MMEGAWTRWDLNIKETTRTQISVRDITFCNYCLKVGHTHWQCTERISERTRLSILMRRKATEEGWTEKHEKEQWNRKIANLLGKCKKVRTI